MREALLGLVVLTLSVTSAAAQQIAAARTAFASSPNAGRGPVTVAMAMEGQGPPIGDMLMAGTVAGVVGIVGGAYVGYKLEEPYCGDDAFFCGLFGGLIGATVGSTVMIPIGVHLVSRDSPFLAKLGMSALMLIGSAALASATNGLGALVMPPAQLIATVWLEDRASRRKHDRRSGR